MSGKQSSLDSRMDIVSTMASSAEGEAGGEHETSENGERDRRGGVGGSGAGASQGSNGDELSENDVSVAHRVLK